MQASVAKQFVRTVADEWITAIDACGVCASDLATVKCLGKLAIPARFIGSSPSVLGSYLFGCPSSHVQHRSRRALRRDCQHR